MVSYPILRLSCISLYQLNALLNLTPDLRGLGDSSKPLTGYDGKTLAEDIHQLVTQLGYNAIYLVGHDIGSFVVYPYAAAHPTEVKRLVVLDVPPPGSFLPPPGERRTSIMVDLIPSNTRRTRSICRR